MDELLERSMEEMQTRKKPLAEASIDANLESKLQWLLVFGDSRKSRPNNNLSRCRMSILISTYIWVGVRLMNLLNVHY